MNNFSRRLFWCFWFSGMLDNSTYHQLRARRALSLFSNVLLRTRRAILLTKSVYGIPHQTVCQDALISHLVYSILSNFNQICLNSPIHIELKSAKLPVMFRQFFGYASDSFVYERVSKIFRYLLPLFWWLFCSNFVDWTLRKNTVILRIAWIYKLHQ